MKVAVITVQVPFVRGEAEVHAVGTVAALRRAGAEVEHVLLPFRRHPPARLLEHIVAARLWRVDEADRVIATKYPGYLVPHRDKVVWVLHRHRPAYDLWEHSLGGLRDRPGGEAVRDAIRRADDAWLPEARRIYAASKTVAARLKRFNGIDADILPPPLEQPDIYRSGAYGDYVLVLGRLSPNKRVELAIEAMRHVRSPARLVIAGAAANPGVADGLRRLVARHGLGDRVEVRARWIGDDEKVELLAGARAVAFTAFDEDFGYVPIEAASSGRATIACSDTGGVADLIVRDGETGLVREPDPRALADAVDLVMGDAAEARRLGEGARDLLGALDLSWDRVVEELLR